MIDGLRRELPEHDLLACFPPAFAIAAAAVVLYMGAARKVTATGGV